MGRYLALRPSRSAALTLRRPSPGGATSDAVVCHALCRGARVVVCGQIAMYDSDAPYPPPLPPEVHAHAEALGISRTRYLVLDHRPRFAAALAELSRLLAAGELHARQTVWEGSP